MLKVVSPSSVRVSVLTCLRTCIFLALPGSQGLPERNEDIMQVDAVLAFFVF